MSRKFSLTEQLQEFEREIALRKEVYPRQVQTGKMRQSVADYHLERMQAVEATLELFREYEAEVRATLEAAIAKKRGAAA